MPGRCGTDGARAQLPMPFDAAYPMDGQRGYL
jgi:hypothetical protein